MDKKSCKNKPADSDCKKGLMNEVKIAVEAVAPELTPLQHSVIAKVVKKTIKHCDKCEQCKDGCNCCDKCRCGCRGKSKGNCCEANCNCCDKCQCDCREKKDFCCKDKSGSCKDSGCCKEDRKCCHKCKCGCCKGKDSCCGSSSEKECYKGVCECCKKCQCGCQGKKAKGGCCSKKGKSGCCEGGCKCCDKCQCGCNDKKSCKKSGEMQMIKCAVEKILGSEKEKVLQMTQIAFDAFVKVTGKPLPTDTRKCPHKFAKKAADLICKMRKKSKFDKEFQERMAEKFWQKVKDKDLKKILKNGKELACKMLFYKCNECEEAVRKGMIKASSQALCVACAMKPASVQCEEEKKIPGKFKKMKSKKECSIKFISTFIDTNKESALACSKAIKAPIEEFLKKNVSPCCVEKFKNKFTPKIIAIAMALSNYEKKADDFYIDIANRYMNSVCFCDKKCIKSCIKLAENGLLFSGMKEECKIHVAAHWAGVMCCQANGKIGCPKKTCTEFFNKWIKDFTPVIEEGFKALEEVKQEIIKEPCGRMKCKVLRRILLEYLKLYCMDGKFNKKDFQDRAKVLIKTLSDKWCSNECCKAK